MKFLSIHLIFASLISFSFTPDTQRADLIFHFDNIEINNGEIEVVLYDSQKCFLKKKKSCVKKRIRVTDNKASVTFEDIPYGAYAAVSYHDINVNKKFDKTTFGLPAEPYSFSKKFEKKYRKPRFGEVKFEIDNQVEEIRMSFQRY